MSRKKTQRIEWWREKVKELSTKRYTQRAIATELKVSLKLINKDLLHMRAQAKNNIQHYVNEYLPLEYENALDTFSMIIKEMWEYKPEDKREFILSRNLIKDLTIKRLELIASGTVVDRAVKFVERYRDSMPQNEEVAIDESRGTKQIPG